MTTLHIDFETRSAADLRKVGVEIYARDPSTDVWCMAYALGDEETHLWKPWRQSEKPSGNVHFKAAMAHVAAGGEVVAHNVAFELAIWNNVMAPRYGWPPLKPEQCRCTMAMAYAMALPGSLEAAVAAVGITEQKDMAGSRVMLQLARPRKVEVHDDWTGRDCRRCGGSGDDDDARPCSACAGTGGEYGPVQKLTWWDVPEKLERLYAYCKQDVNVERQLERRLRPLSEHESAVWLLDYQINQRGLHIDRAAIEAAIRLVDAEKLRLDGEMRAITGNTVSACSNVNQLTDWLRWQGVETGGVAKADVAALLEGDLPDNARRALALRQEAARSSTAKLTAMLERAGDDDRIRGTKQYHGASTGRWAGRGAQPDNYPRGKLKPREVDAAIRLIQRGERDAVDLLYGAPMDVVSSCLRGFITAAPGHDLIACDYSAIEARVLAWLAGQEDVLDVFRTHGKIYEKAAAIIFGVPIEAVTKAQRQIGKVAVLALGYQGGVGAFQTMARGYGITVSDEQAEQIKVAWREAHPQIVQYWWDLEKAAISAVRTGRQTKAGAEGREAKFKVNGSFLWCQLPSKRLLCYPYPRIVEKEMPWGAMKDALRYKGVNSITRKWVDIDTYGGKLCENLTQAVARDLLADGLLRLSQHGYRIVMHVHDEAVAEVPTDFGSLDEMARLMSQLPTWAKGLPVTAEGWRGPRYRK